MIDVLSVFIGVFGPLLCAIAFFVVSLCLYIVAYKRGNGPLVDSRKRLFVVSVVTLVAILAFYVFVLYILSTAITNM